MKTQAAQNALPRKVSRTWRVVRCSVKVFLISIIVSLIWSWGRFFWPGPDFVGSPPRQTCKRNNLDFSKTGDWYAQFGKGFRPSRHVSHRFGWLGTIFSPGLYVGPIVHYLSGWDVYEEEVCTVGLVTNLTIWEEDGDFIFHVTPLDPDNELGYARYGWRPDHRATDKANKKLVLVEIDGGPRPIRKNFPILPELANGDMVLVCGRLVTDRAHEHHMEIHPARWLQILQYAAAPKDTVPRKEK